MTQTAQPNIGLGAVISIGTQGGSPTFTPIAKVKKISPPKPKWGTEDITTLDSGIARRKIKTLIDNGEVTISGLYASADPGQVALLAAFNAPSNTLNGGAYPFKIALPVDLPGGQTTTGDTLAFSALVTGFETDDETPDKVVEFTATLTIDGATTFTEGS